MSWNNISGIIVQKGDKYIVWELKFTITHEDPLILYHPSYKGAWCNVTFEWDIGYNIIDRLSIITLYDPFICYFYTNDKNMFLKV